MIGYILQPFSARVRSRVGATVGCVCVAADSGWFMEIGLRPARARAEPGGVRRPAVALRSAGSVPEPRRHGALPLRSWLVSILPISATGSGRRPARGELLAPGGMDEP